MIHSRIPHTLGRACHTALILLVNGCVFAIAATACNAQPTPATATLGQTAPDAAFTTVSGKAVELKSYRGHPVIVWQVTTWCPSCAAGLRTFAHHQAQIDRSDMTVIVLRAYKNGGYPGPSMRDFANSVAPNLLHDAHFVFGQDTQTLFERYNPRKFVDVYQVIAPDGRIALASSSPSATFDKIEEFVRPKP